MIIAEANIMADVDSLNHRKVLTPDLVIKGHETGAQLFVMDLSQKPVHRAALLPSVDESPAGNIGNKALEFGEKAKAAASAFTAGTVSTIADMSHRTAAASGPLAEQAIEKLTVAKDMAAEFAHQATDAVSKFAHIAAENTVEFGERTTSKVAELSEQAAEAIAPFTGQAAEICGGQGRGIGVWASCCGRHIGVRSKCYGRCIGAERENDEHGG